MKLLVLGGTSFVGRHLVLAARAAGIDVTLFNRGQTNPGLFADLEHIAGDRSGDLSPLQGRRWDAVLDVNGYVPQVVGAGLDVLAAACDHYTFVSTLSVYEESGAQGPDEDSPLATPEYDATEVTNERYGPLKVACETVVRERMPDRSLIVRPGLVVGPHDPTERFVRWVRRAADGGDVLAPAPRDRGVTFIDGRDLGDWVIRLIVTGDNGTYNAIGPRGRLTMGELLDTCVEATGGGATLTWAAEQFLLDNDVAPWVDLPLWLPEAGNGLLVARNERAVEAGLTFRPLADTVRATLRWDTARNYRGVAGLPVERERELLAAWHADPKNAPEENRQ